MPGDLFNLGGREGWDMDDFVQDDDLSQELEELTKLEELKREHLRVAKIVQAYIATLSRIRDSELGSVEGNPQLTALFTQVVKQYSEWKGHTAGDWLAIGVPRSVLLEAGMLPPIRQPRQNDGGSQG